MNGVARGPVSARALRLRLLQALVIAFAIPAPADPSYDRASRGKLCCIT
jgi:hypothetical protein